MTSRLTRSSSDSLYESYYSLPIPEEFARQEWIKAYGEPKTFEEHQECEEYVKSKKLVNKKSNCNIV